MHVKGKAPNHLKNKSECVNLHFSLGKTEEFLSGWKGKNKLFQTRLNHFVLLIHIPQTCLQTGHPNSLRYGKHRIDGLLPGYSLSIFA